MLKKLLIKWHNLKASWDLFKKLPRIEERLWILEENLYAEFGKEPQRNPRIMTFEQTVQWVIDNKGSVCRFGDGELHMAMCRPMLFQVPDIKMQSRLLEILANPVHNCLCCMTDIFGSLEGIRYDIQLFSRRMAVLARKYILPKASPNYKIWGNTEATRPYWPSLDINRAKIVFDMWKRVFKDRDILLVEGKCTRFGVGNDLLDGAKSVRRVLCPPTDAFARYDEILSATKACAKKHDLILLALGGTATILAYDLAKSGYQAIDIGHLDIQYSYMKMGVKDRVMVPGKYTSECGGYGTSLVAQRTESEIRQTIKDLTNG